MKRTTIYLALLIFVIFGCKHAKTPITQTGVYKLEKQMVSYGKKDTVYARIQVKIYP